MAPSAEVLSKRVICKEPDRYIGWPTIERTRAGELIVVFSGDRDGHICPWGKTELVRSSDEGATWSDPVVIRNTPPRRPRRRLVETSDGTLISTWFTSVEFENNERYKDPRRDAEPGGAGALDGALDPAIHGLGRHLGGTGQEQGVGSPWTGRARRRPPALPRPRHLRRRAWPGPPRNRRTRVGRWQVIGTVPEPEGIGLGEALSRPKRRAASSSGCSATARPY